MARLPSAFELQRRPSPSVTPDVRVRQIDYSPAETGAKAIARGVGEVSNQLSLYAKAQSEVTDYETKKKLIEFNLQTEMDLEEKKRVMPEGGSGFARTYQQDYDKRARDFFKTIPADQRDKVDLALVHQNATLTERASKYELAERDRSTRDGLVSTLETLSRVVEGNPDRKDAEHQKGLSLIDAAPIEPDTKHKLRKLYGEQVDEIAARTKIKSATTAEQFKAVADELTARTPGADLTSTLTSGKSRGKAAGWAASDPTWAKLNSFQKAAAMSLMEADNMDPVDAKNALGAMINRAAKNGEDLGAHVSQKIYQPTIEPGQQARLGRILNSPQFQQLTAWAEARAAGHEPDPVNGATHFLAPERTMLALERSDPQKYKNWGPRGANWSNFDEATGEYKGVVTRDKSHAFLAPDGAYDGAGPAYEGPYKNLSFDKRDQLANELRRQRNEVGKKLIDEIEEVEKTATLGKLTPGFDALVQKVKSFDDPALNARMHFAWTKSVLTNEVRMSRPDEAAAKVNELRRQIGPTATPAQVELLSHMDTVANKVQSEVRKDPLAWANEVGAIKTEAIDFNSPDLPSQLKKRAEDAMKVSAYYRVPPRLFTDAQRDALADGVKAGGQALVGTIAKMSETWGPELTTVAVKEISDKVPEAAVAGYLLANKINPQTAMDISTTLQRRQDPNYRPANLPRTQSEPIALEVLGDVYRNFPPQQRDAILGAADAVFEARIAKSVAPKTDAPEVYKKALAEVVGVRQDPQGNTYGGPVSTAKGGWFGAGKDKQIMLPSTWRNDKWRDVLESVTISDLASTGHPLPMDASGKPLSMVKMANAQLVQVGPNKFAVALGDPATPGNEQWVSTAIPTEFGAVRQPFVLDFSRIERVARKRMPSAFWAD